MVFKKFMSYFYDPKGSIRFQMEDWYKTPQSFHEGAVRHLTKERKVVQTISVVEKWTSNEVSTLLIDEKKYRLTIFFRPI